jgi:hypothetical protein
VRLPRGEAQIKHIFRKKEGHIEDTPENRRLLIDTAKEEVNFVGTKANGNRWYVKDLDDGTQVWVEVRNGVIQNGGVNNPPITEWTARGIEE